MARPLKTEAIKNFLNHKARPEFAALYNPNMEVQVNVAQGQGERVDKTYAGKSFSAWTDGDTTWKSFRIPQHANTNPTYTDYAIGFDLAIHTEGIGLTGWDWVEKRSRWVAFDFDAIMGHSDKHQQKLTDVELNAVKQAAYAIPWVTIYKSTSGNGLHLYVFVDTPTNNHTEHAALARSILGRMSAIAGYDFNSKVDNCGGVLWFWHRKFEKAGGVNGEGLKLLKKGETLTDVPINWRDHLKVTSGARRKIAIGFTEAGEEDTETFEEMCGQHQQVPLDDAHKQFVKYLEQHAMGSWWWDSDHHMMVAHTYDLKKAHEDLKMRGLFETIAEGKVAGDQNCFMFPMRNGVWAVRRHTPGVREHDLWDQDAGGWTRCFFNREPDLKSVAKAFMGAEDDNGAFEFRQAGVALSAAAELGGKVDLKEAYHQRRATLKPHKDGRLIFEIDRNKDDPDSDWLGWVNKTTKWRKVLATQIPAKYEQEVSNHDDILRHMVSGEEGDAGWMVRVGNIWKQEPLLHVRLALKALGNSANETELIMGHCVLNRWTLVNYPFMPEYVGSRMWNRDGAQFAMTPSQDMESLHYPTWKSLLAHIGSSLDTPIKYNAWAKTHGITSGAEYLMLWIASVFQFPNESLPYLFLYGEQGTGKTTLHEALSLLVTRGVVKADAALVSPNGFNGELMSAVLCTVEETDLRTNKTAAYNRIKEWVTGATINIHVKGTTPFSAPNTCHWIHTANGSENCPIFPGDTRITMIHVPPLDPKKYIAKRDLMDLLRKEAPDFLAAILGIEIPLANDRMALPIIETEDKKKASKLNQTELESFIEEQCHLIDGSLILLSEFYNRFKEWLDPERRSFWTRTKMSRHMPEEIVKGRLASDGNQFYFGNVSWIPRQPTDPIKPAWVVLDGEKLVPHV